MSPTPHLLLQINVPNSSSVTCDKFFTLACCLCKGDTSPNSDVVTENKALPGHQNSIVAGPKHAVLRTRLIPPFPDNMERAIFGMGCFWGAERKFWNLNGVYSTQVGFAGGFSANPTYNDVCTGLTGHAEVVRVIYDPSIVTYETLLQVFWENHNPTQGNRQGNDRGSEYRSAIYTFGPVQQQAAENSRRRYQEALRDSGFGKITTEIVPATKFFYADDAHQQYLHKNPYGYCGLGGTGVSCPRGLVKK